MATGSKVGFQDNVPLHGEFNIVQETATTDVMTITLASSGSGDFIVCENSAGTELFVVNSAGAAKLAGETTFSSWPVVKGGTITIASNATSASATATGLTTAYSVLVNPIVADAGLAVNVLPAANKVTVFLSASVGSACTFNYVAFKTGS
jgi:hypothetical protein